MESMEYVYLVWFDPVQYDVERNLEGIFTMPEMAVEAVRKANPRNTKNWPYHYEVEIWPLNGGEKLGEIKSYDGALIWDAEEQAKLAAKVQDYIARGLRE